MKPWFNTTMILMLTVIWIIIGWQLHKRLSHVELRQRVNSDRSSEINRIMKEERVMPTRKQESETD